jgi:hypothetical protein
MLPCKQFSTEQQNYVEFIMRLFVFWGWSGGTFGFAVYSGKNRTISG